MEKLDEVTVSILKAASIDERMLLTLNRDDLRDLFPGPEHFIRRKHVWSIIHPEEDHPVPQKPETTSPRVATASPRTADAYKSPLKTLQLPSPPEYVVYTDSELEQCRKTYSELALAGREHECVMSKELRCRLVRNTITSMVSLLRASKDQMERYPSKTEITAMAKRIVEYYPMLQDQDTSVKHESINAKLQKRLQNIKTPTKKQGPTPDRGRPKRRLTDLSPSDKEADDEDADCSSSSGASTLLLSPASNSDDASTSSDKDSLLIQARHYKTLQEMCKKPKPNQDDVSQLLDLEFEARRAFIDSDSMKEENRASLILDAYPCFKELHHALGELRRILEPENKKFISQIKLRWEEFCSRVEFYGVSKKAMKPPMTMDKTEAHLALMKALPTLFPSPAHPPKKMGTPCQAFLHVLKPTEDPDSVLQKRSLPCPVVVFDGSKCVIAVGNLPITTFDKEKLGEAMIYVMAYFYALHLTYPKCVATLLSVIQTEVLQDAIHEGDTTSSYRKALAEFHAFIGK
ncbi:unnamed protein product [Knipowitschia caucasica]